MIPAETIIKLSCRLVPDQDPDKIAHAVKHHIESASPEGVKVEVNVHPDRGRPVRTAVDTKVAKIASQAVSETFGGKPCGIIATGGSLPVISEMAHYSGAETVFLGFGLDTDCIHAPNEHFSLERIRFGFVMIQRLIELMSES